MNIPQPLVIWDPRFPPSPLLIGDQFVLCAGIRFRQEAIQGLHRTMTPVGGPAWADRTYAWIVPEPTNPHDRNARAIYIGDCHAGYLPRDIASLMKDDLDRLAQLRAPDGRPVGYPSCLAQIYISPSEDLLWEVALFGPWPFGLGHEAHTFHPEKTKTKMPRRKT